MPEVFIGDEDAPTLLAVDEEGLPTVAFGIDGEKQFADVEALDVQPEEDLNPFGTDHIVTAELITADDPAIVVPLVGDTIEFRVVDVTETDTLDEADEPDFAQAATGRRKHKGSLATRRTGLA